MLDPDRWIRKRTLRCLQCSERVVGVFAFLGFGAGLEASPFPQWVFGRNNELFQEIFIGRFRCLALKLSLER